MIGEDFEYQNQYQTQKIQNKSYINDIKLSIDMNQYFQEKFDKNHDRKYNSVIIENSQQE